MKDANRSTLLGLPRQFIRGLWLLLAEPQHIFHSAEMRMLAVLIATGLCATISGVPIGTATASDDCPGVGATFAGGSGTSAEPYEVADDTQLASISGDYLGCSFLQTADIALAGNWTPIGSNASPFTGAYEGNGRSVTGINVAGGDWAGLFGKVVNGSIRNLTIAGEVSGGRYVGGLAGVVEESSVSGITSTVDVSGVEAVGGIAGYAWRASSIEDVTVTATVGTTGVSSFDIGGVVGFMSESLVRNANVRGNIATDDTVSAAGGIAGWVENSTLEAVSFSGDVGDRSISDSIRVGGIAGLLEESTIANARVGAVDDTAVIGGGASIGGIAGDAISIPSAPSVISDVIVYAEISGARDYVGGVAGFAEEISISGAEVIGVVGGNKYIGGIAGSTWSFDISESVFTGDVSATSDVGGLVGEGGNNACAGVGFLTLSYSQGGVVSSAGPTAGGLAGYLDCAIVSRSYSTMSVSGVENDPDKGFWVGGLIGITDSSEVYDSYSTGAVTGTVKVGGLIGETFTTSVFNSYSTGAVTGDDSTGGLIGLRTGTSPVQSSFWDIDTSNIAVSDGGEPRTTGQMQTLSTFSEADWSIVQGSDCTSTWGIMPSRNQGYPYLQDFYTRNCPDPSPPAPVALPPSAPTAAVAQAGDSLVTVQWSSPLSSGSFPISTYQVIGFPAGSCVVTAPATTCDIEDLPNGVAYTFQVRALNGAGWSPWSTSTPAVTPEPAEVVSILIAGSRTEMRGSSGVRVAGVTSGLGVGAVVRPWVRLPGQTSFTQGAAQVTVNDSGEFTWQRRIGKRVTVFFSSEDGLVKSQRVTIQRR